MHAEFAARPAWRETGNPRFPRAARVSGEWWVLRINGFPDHPVWTFFIDGRRQFDVDDAPVHWGADAPMLTAAEAADALSGLTHLTVYGSEVGRPCDAWFCCGSP